MPVKIIIIIVFVIIIKFCRLGVLVNKIIQSKIQFSSLEDIVKQNEFYNLFLDQIQ